MKLNINKFYFFLVILLFGLFFRIYLVSNGDFIFHMDNARDMVDIREIVLLGKHRLIGPTSGVEGLYNGPGWYYLMAIPFLVSGGDPYALVIFQSVLWMIGGFFLLLIISRWGVKAIVLVGSIWVSSNLLILTSQNSLSPNGVILLMPVLIYLFEKYLQTRKLIFSILTWFVIGIFFQFEMATAIFLPLVVFISAYIINRKILFDKKLWIGFGVLFLTLLPQIIFDLRHDFIMTQSLWRYINLENNQKMSLNLLSHLTGIYTLYKNVISALLMNYLVLLVITVISLLLAIKSIFNLKTKDRELIIICVLIFLIPLIGYIILPIRVMSWHVAGVVTLLLIILGWMVGMNNQGGMGKITTVIALLGITLSIFNIQSYNREKIDNLHSGDPSLFKNELAAIDYIYNQAQGKNFKVYIYIPSVIDYPYQYLIYWHGLKKYGYLPQDYAYLPDKPVYIEHKQFLPFKYAQEDSDLVFLVQESDSGNTKHLWLNSFINLKMIKKEKIGPIDIEIRKQSES